MSDTTMNDPDRLRVLFCFGTTPAFYEADDETLGLIRSTIIDAYSDLQGRFGMRVLGTFDDDQLQVGSATSFPWVGYVLVEAPDLASVRKVTNLLREFRVGSERLWRYMSIEARVGRRLFYGNE
ncbi:MAG: hypothetical protein D3X82_12550 [Candidatus Leucobacter sulfamidivorax]|nr:hypothetical protein [Candidatus Leucobacter sulfamidivorax]